MLSQLSEIKQNNEKFENCKNTALPIFGREGGEKPIFHKVNNRINIIQKNWKKDLDQREKKMKEEIFKDSVRAIPTVSYHPHTAVQLLRSTERENLFFNAINCNNNNNKKNKILPFNSDISTKYNNGNTNNFNKNIDENDFRNQNITKSLNTNNVNLKHTAEIQYLKVINSAQNGDKEVLYDFFL